MSAEPAKKSNTETTNKKKFYYSTPDNAVLCDTALHPTVYKLYNILVMHANIYTHSTSMGVPKLADELGRSERTVQRCLQKLIQLGIISREFRKCVLRWRRTVFSVRPKHFAR